MKEIQVFSNIGPRPLQRGDNHKNVKMRWGSFKNFLFQNHWAKFNQTWRKSFLGGRGFQFYKWRGYPFSKGR
jgi:hypothetical protein